MPKLIDLTGQTYGRLTVIERVPSKKKAALWRCRCSCGNESIVQSGNLRNGHTKSCGKCNSITDCGAYMECKTKSGKTFIFDRDDLPLVKSRVWYMDKYGYVNGCEGDGAIKLHRLIMKPPEGMVIDHINNDPSDCRRDNLRIVSQHQNTMNHSLNRNSTTGFKGVCFDKKEGRYMAHIHPNRRMIFLGYYDNPKEAALAYDKAASFYFGEYAKLNFE